MATATKKPSPPAKSREEAPAPSSNPFLLALDRVYRFLASLKLAVISLSCLSILLGFATWVESRYGTKASAEWVYQTPAFAVVLAFLAANILCAALIRYPWKKRQTGFVVTHIGLLVVLAGAFVSYWGSDEGSVGIVEGEPLEQVLLMRSNHPVMRVRSIDPKTGEATHVTSMPFNPGILAWKPGRYETLSESGDPFQFALKAFLPSSYPKYLHEAVEEGGSPMIKIGALFQPPGAIRASDLFADDVVDREAWFNAANDFRRVVKKIGPMRVAVQFVKSPTMMDDFLNPPADTSKRVARFHYADRQGKDRTYEWTVDEGEIGKSFNLPDSDLSASPSKVESFPDEGGPIRRSTGESSFPVLIFNVRKAGGPEVPHVAGATLPTIADFMDLHAGQGTKELVRVTYFHPHAFAPGDRGLIEIMGTTDGSFAYRVFTPSGLRSKGKLKQGDFVQAFGGPNQPMSFSFKIDQFIPSGRERFTYIPVDLPVGDLEKAIPAVQVEMTVDGETREFWVRRAGDFNPSYQKVQFPRHTFEIAYDVDRVPLGFRMDLDDFHFDVNVGTQVPATFVSKVRVTDPDMGIKDEPHVISMNEPMTHRDWTFYQQAYHKLTDDDGRETGQVMSIFQVGYNPGRRVTYVGCVLVVLGIFVQFYMRAGVFTDGGRRERAIAAAKQAKTLARGKKSMPGAASDPAPTSGVDTDKGASESDFEEL